MEEQRIGMMYLNLFKHWVIDRWDRMFPRGFRRSSALPVLVIVLVIGLPVLGWELHQLGRFHALKSEIKGEQTPAVPSGPRPGGLDPIILKRRPSAASNLPEFSSATLLPGLGMEMLQITAFMPRRGDVELLDAPSAKDLADGTGPARNGSTDRWGAIEAPWSGLLTGTLTPLANTFRSAWRGRTVEAPADTVGRGTADGGLMTLLAADSTQATPDSAPTSATGVFKNTDFDEHWASRSDVTVGAKLSADSIELSVTVKNVGDNPEPIGIGWNPRFLVAAERRGAAELRLPAGDVMEVADRIKGVPSGKFSPAPATVSRFQPHSTAIGPESIDAVLAHMRPAMLESGVSAELRVPEDGFGLRMTALSQSIHELHVSSPSGARYVSLGMQTNFEDPLGKEWAASEKPPIDTLLPGETIEYRIRLEIFAVANR